MFTGLLWTTASRAALFLYTAPFFVVIGSRIFSLEAHFTLQQWVGLALSFAGMALAFGWPVPSADPRQLLGDALMIAAAASWAATTLIVRGSKLNSAPAEIATIYQLAVSAVMLTAVAILFDPPLPGWPSAMAGGLVVYQAVWVTGLTSVIWLGLIVRYSANKLSAFTFLTPLFGVMAGHLVLNEPLTPAFLAAVGLVVVGLLIVNRPVRKMKQI